MITPPARCWAVLLSALSVGACGAATPPAESPPAEPPPPRAEAKPPASEPPPPPPQAPPEAPPGPPPKVTGKAPPPGEEETRTMTGSMCKTLQGILGGLVHKSELAKIDPKLEISLRQRAENAAVESAKTVSESFHDTCMQSFVGKPIRREILDCMLKAKDFATFDRCNR